MIWVIYDKKKYVDEQESEEHKKKYRKKEIKTEIIWMIYGKKIVKKINLRR